MLLKNLETMPLGDRLADLSNLDLFSALLEQMPTAVAMLDCNLCYLLVSRRWLRDYGLENQDIIGRSHWELFPQLQLGGDGENLAASLPQATSHWQEIYAAGLAGESLGSECDYFIQSNGSRQWVKWRLQPWRTSTGEIGGVIMLTEFLDPDSCESVAETATLKDAIAKWQQEFAPHDPPPALPQKTQQQYCSLIAAYLEGTEAALRESEERFRATFEQAAVGIKHTSVDGCLLRVNQKFCDILGYPREELLRLSSRDITNPADQENEQVFLRSLLAGKMETYVLEKRYLRKDGILVWVQITASLVRNQQGEPKYFVHVVQDINSRKATELALRDSEIRLRQKARREALLNRLATQIRNSLELNTILETTVQQIRQLLQIDRCQFAWYQADQVQSYWQVVQEDKAADLPDLTGYYPAHLIGQLAQQLLNLEIVRIDDLNTVTNPIFQQFVDALGYQSVLLLPMQTPSGNIGVISCSHSRKARPWLDSEVELLQAVLDQLLIAIKQAELYAASCQATQQAQEQATELGQALYKLQRTQAQLIQTEKMSSLGQLVAGVAHEINNPVNFIYGNLIYAQEYCQDLLSLVQLYRTAYPNPPLMIRERIDAIDLDFMMSDLAKLQNSMKVGAERIREIVRSLRTFSRSDESGYKLVDIHSGIESTLMILQYRLKGKPGVPSISVIKDYSELPLVECCPGQINQVFMNLLSNAIDALEEKLNFQHLEASNNQLQPTIYFSPTITIHTGIVSGDSSSSRGMGEEGENGDNYNIFIRIADNGPGMTKQIQKQLFDPFFTTKPAGRGTGLGLAICYQIVVEKHGGRLLCNSAPGQGAEFVVLIPIKYRGEQGV